MNLIPTIINLFTPIVTYLIPPVLPPMLPPEHIQQQQDVYISSIDSNSYEILTSWYGPGFHGRLTANGEIFDQYAMTAASPYLPFGTQLRVSYRGRSIVVTINDRGPYEGNRELDLSRGAADALGIDGVAYVRVTQLN